VTLFLLATPEIVCTLGSHDSQYNAYSDERSSGDALELAGKVNATLVPSCVPNCPRISMFRNPTAANLMLIRDGDQIKLVSKPRFVTSVYERYGDGGIPALIGHEAGHAIDGKARAPWMKSNWNAELRADAWSGCALARMNLSSRSLQLGLKALEKYPPTSNTQW